jgi:tripartite-type tricarboxylate transporter receptor subunit TctC
MNSSTISRRKFCAAAILSTTPLAFAQSERFPSRPIQLIVPFSAGAFTDIVARTYGAELRPLLGQPIIIENKPGAGGIAASQALLAAPPDGYQVLAITSAHILGPLVQKLPYDTAGDFSALVLLGTYPMIAVVRNDHPAKTLKDLIAMARTQPDAVSYGSAGHLSGIHLCGEYFAQAAGVKLLHVPYKGGQESVRDVIGGRLDVSFPAIGVVIEMVKGGKIRALGVSSAKRTPQLPDVPTFAEGGLAGFDYSVSFGTVVASKTPRDRKETLAGHLQALTRKPEFAARLVTLGLVPSGIALDEYEQYLATESRMLEKVVRDAKLVKSS